MVDTLKFPKKMTSKKMKMKDEMTGYLHCCPEN